MKEIDGAGVENKYQVSVHFRNVATEVTYILFCLQFSCFMSSYELQQTYNKNNEYLLLYCLQDHLRVQKVVEEVFANKGGGLKMTEGHKVCFSFLVNFNYNCILPIEYGYFKMIHVDSYQT